jgi:hypothetical protein
MAPSRARAHVTFASVATPLAIVTGALIWVAVSTGGLLSNREDAGAAAGTVAPAPIVTPLVPDSETGLALPKKLGSVRFAVVGDVGRGDDAQYGTAAQMALWHEQFDFSFVLMLGDNMYAAGTPADYAARFERPYQSLLAKGVMFYAANGNHHPRNILDYPLYNMRGNRYYTFSRSEGALGLRHVKFVAVDTVTLDNVQLAWLRRELGASDDGWEICFYHHPLYTSGRYGTGALRVRRMLEPVFRQFGVDVGLAGHEHVYERIVPQGGVLYFTSGAGGALRRGDVHRTWLTSASFDTDTHFILMEISGNDLYFQAISRTGQTIDTGHIERLTNEQRRRPLSIGK